ncbi:FKBP-type peptidyl-prolyl cis-trans isomerase [Rhodohalobacter sp. 8-1]|uniref:FKBP-type peptidyl-prolyl cis-trans isomerase n=1 Tax=Rhodohalobacter sp. 8-1 TaxID=3131972 RepID=UPI0030EDA3F7
MISKKLLLILIPATLLVGCLDSTSPEFDDYDNTADLEFLEENAQRDDVTVTESGLQYRVIEEADGTLPAEESIAVFNFIGTFYDGEVFNDTFDEGQPIVTTVNSLPPGLSEGLQLAPIGSRYEFVLPPDLGYGNNPPPGFPPGAVLIFEVEVLHSSNYDPIFLDQNAEREEVMVTESGLQYRIIEEGSGESPANDSSVSVEYTGTFIYGETFDTSRDTDGPATFDLNGVIEGFSEGIQLMQEGARYEFFIPGNLAYGQQPPQQSLIYPDATLIFDVELISVNDE